SADAFLSLDQIRRPFADRQARLAGPNAFDPQGIARRRDEVQAQLGRADAAIRDPDATPKEREAAQERFRALATEADNLLKDLEHLTQTGDELAAIQEKLGAAERERSGQ